MFDFNKYMTGLLGTISMSNCSSEEYREMEKRLQEVKEIWNRKPRDFYGTNSEGDEKND